MRERDERILGGWTPWLASGRLTEEEATCLRTAAGTAAFEHGARRHETMVDDGRGNFVHREDVYR